MENKYERWEPTPLKEWSDSNHLNLTAELLDNVDKWLREISTHNNIKDGERNWKEYLNDHEEELNELLKNNINGVEKEMTKQNENNYVIATEKDFDENNRYIGKVGPEVNLEIDGRILEHIGKDLSGMFKDVELRSVTFNENNYVVATEEDFDENNRYIGKTGPEVMLEVNLDMLKSIGKDFSGMFKDIEVNGVKIK